jgi:hypothetical protein
MGLSVMKDYEQETDKYREDFAAALVDDKPFEEIFGDYTDEEIDQIQVVNDNTRFDCQDCERGDLQMSKPKLTNGLLWSKEAIYWLLRFGRKNDGNWFEKIKDGEEIPNEAYAPLIAAAPQLYDVLKKVEWGGEGECPCCGRFHYNDNTGNEQNHFTDCELAAALKAAEVGK